MVKNLENVYINFKTLADKSNNIIEPDKTVYMYIDIESNLETADISEVIISFKVEQSWFEDNNIDKETVLFIRSDNNNWQEFTTVMTDQDSNYVYYESIIPGFSTFAIVGSEMSGIGILDYPLNLIIVIALIITVIIIIVVILFKTGHLYFDKK